MKSNRTTLGRIISHVFLVLWSVSVGMLLYWTIIASLKTNKSVFKELWRLPEALNFGNYLRALSELNFASYSLNSLLIVSTSVAMIIVVSLPASYALTRMNMKWKNPLTLFYVAGMGIPVQLLFIPLFKSLSAIHLVDTPIGLIVVFITLSIPFTVFLLTGFFVTIPSEMEESAAIDGSGEFRTFYRIMVPMAGPGIITAVIVNFILLWNEYVLALIFITGKKYRTLSLGLYNLYAALQYSSDWVSIFAGSVLVIIPTLIIFILLSEKLIAGITAGSIK
jgi:ABC-type glycerol-3-phosphate transport system permease component